MFTEQGQKGQAKISYNIRIGHLHWFVPVRLAGLDNRTTVTPVSVIVSASLGDFISVTFICDTKSHTRARTNTHTSAHPSTNNKNKII